MWRRALSIVLSVFLLGTTGFQLLPDLPAKAAPRRDVGIELADGATDMLFIPADGQTTVLASRSQRASREPARAWRPVHVIDTQLRMPTVLEPAARPPAFHRKQPLTRSLSRPSPIPA